MSNPNIYDRIASTLLTAALESSNQLYSDTIDPPLPFQSGDVLGMYLPIDGSNGARLLVNFGIDAGSIYETRNIAVPLSSIVLGQEVDNDRVFLALETSECTTYVHALSVQCSDDHKSQYECILCITLLLCVRIRIKKNYMYVRTYIIHRSCSTTY